MIKSLRFEFPICTALLIIVFVVYVSSEYIDIAFPYIKFILSLIFICIFVRNIIYMYHTYSKLVVFLKITPFMFVS